MSLFPSDMPRPAPDHDDAGFWAGCAEKSLRFQACGSCDMLRHPPTPICRVCHSIAVKWVEAPPEAVVYTYNVVHHASHPAVRESLPYVGAVVEFPALPGVRLVTNITDIDPHAVTIGMPVQLHWDDIAEGMFVPRFRPSAG